MAESKTRIGGSGFTSFSFKGQRLAYLQTLNDQPPRPVGQTAVVQPIDESVPLEIVTAQAVGAGTLQLRFYEVWNTPVWAQLPGFESTNNLLEVLKQQIQQGEISCRKVVRSPSGVTRARVYHGCVITDVDEGESISIETMTLPKTITMMYTHTTAL